MTTLFSDDGADSVAARGFHGSARTRGARRGRSAIRAAGEGGVCPYAVGSPLHHAWSVGRRDADMRYVLALPYAERGRAVAYLHGYWSAVIERSGPGFPVISSGLLDAAWECGERAAGGNVDDGAVVLLGAMVEDAFRRAYDIGRRDGA